MDEQMEKISNLEQDATIRTNRIANLRTKVTSGEAAVDDLGPPPEVPPLVLPSLPVVIRAKSSTCFDVTCCCC